MRAGMVGLAALYWPIAIGNGLLADKRSWKHLPDQVRDWLALQTKASQVPARRELVIETFPRAAKYYLVCYPFEGRLLSR
mgnify:CR=1 FL=1